MPDMLHNQVSGVKHFHPAHGQMVNLARRL